jgi:hypothetical protein
MQSLMDGERIIRSRLARGLELSSGGYMAFSCRPTIQIFATSLQEGTPVSSLLQENFVAGATLRLSLLVILQTLTSYAAIKRVHVSLIFRLRHLFQETGPVALE